MDKRETTWYPWLFFLGVTTAEVLIAAGDDWAGLMLHIALLILLMVQFSLGREQRLYLGLMLVPLIRLLSLVLPMGNIPLVFRYFAISVPLFAACFAVTRLAGYRAADIGLVPGWWHQQAAIALVGVPLGVIEYLILRPQPLVTSFRAAELIVPALVLLISTGFLEELIFRGVIQKAAADLMGPVRAAVFVSVLFAAMHITHLSWLDVVFVLGVAFFFSWAVFRTRSLTGVVVAHGINNILLYLVLPFLHLR